MTRQRVALVVVRRAEDDVSNEPVVLRRLSFVVQLDVAQKSDRALSEHECLLVATTQVRLRRFAQLHVRCAASRAYVHRMILCVSASEA